MKNTHQFISVLSLTFLLTACGSDSKPLDTDGDGVPDSADVFPSDPTESKDTDGDGVGDNADAFPEDATETLDTDSDNIGDNTDNCPTVANTDQINQDVDTVGDACDAFPQDATETLDTDNDGVGDNADVFPQNPNETLDTDNDTIGDNADNCPQIANIDQTNTDANFENGDTFGDVCDADIDADGVLNTTDVFPLDPDESVDEDGDSIGDNKDLDITSPNNQVENSISLTRLLATGRATRFIGPQANSNPTFLNNQVVNAGDVNKDGFDDMLVSIPGYRQDPTTENYTGIAYLFFGGVTWPQTIDLNHIPETVPHVIFEKQTTDVSPTRIGYSLAALGDVNGDTIDDFAIGASRADSSTIDNAGAVHIVYGRTSWLADAGDDHTISYSDLKSNYALNFYGDGTDLFLGHSIANIGDFNGDGLSDIAMGQPRYNSAGATLVGRLYVLFGGAQFNQPVGTSVNIDSIPDNQRVRITGSDPARALLGYKILPLGNFDNDTDNTQDILVRSGNGKEYYVLFGQKNLPANVDLTYPMTTDHGFKIESSVAFLDVSMGHLLADASNSKDILIANRRNLYIIKGGLGDWPASIDIANLPEEYGIEVPHSLPISSYASLAMLPDSNQDGLDEPIISSINTSDEIDRVQKIVNSNGWLAEASDEFTVNENIQNIMKDYENDNFVWSLEVVGDMNSDGQLEFVINVPLGDTENGIDSGDFYVVKGFSQVYPQ